MNNPDYHQNSLMVSVCMITYNHESYIEEAINSILSQKTNFNFELIISNDCSKDRTHSIIQKMISNHPFGHLIKYFNQGINLGITENFLFTLKKAQGRYIAICEGDDYWTDNNKLQMQVDIMEENMEMSGCATQASVIEEGNLSITPRQFRIVEKDVLQFSNLLSERPFHTASLLFRNILPLDKFPLNILSADRFLYLLISSFGGIRFINIPTCVYRKNDGGISRRVTSKELRKDLKMVEILKSINHETDEKALYRFIHKTIINYSSRLYLSDFIISYFTIGYYNLQAPKKNMQELKSMVLNFLPKLIAVSNHKKVTV